MHPTWSNSTIWHPSAPDSPTPPPDLACSMRPVLHVSGKSGAEIQDSGRKLRSLHRRRYIVATGANPWLRQHPWPEPPQGAAYVARALARSHPERHGPVACPPPAPSAVVGNRVPPGLMARGAYVARLRGLEDPHQPNPRVDTRGYDIPPSREGSGNDWPNNGEICRSSQSTTGNSGSRPASGSGEMQVTRPSAV